MLRGHSGMLNGCSRVFKGRSGVLWGRSTVIRIHITLVLYPTSPPSVGYLVVVPPPTVLSTPVLSPPVLELRRGFKFPPKVVLLTVVFINFQFIKNTVKNPK